MRIYHSYLVALDGVDAIYKDKVQVGSRFLPVSESYRAAFRAFVDRYQPKLIGDLGVDSCVYTS